MQSKVLLFRAPTENDSNSEDSYEKYLKANGLSVQSVPVLQFQFVNLDKLAERLRNPEAYSGLVFTSPRSVEAVRQCQQNYHINLLPWTKLSTYVVGEATGQLVDSKLQLPRKGQESGNAGALAQFILSDDHLIREKQLLFPSADIRRETLPNTLHSASVKVDSLIVYETKVLANLDSCLKEVLNVTDAAPVAMVFFNPSGVVGVIEALNKISVSISNFKLFAIGTSTEDALKSKNLIVSGTASKPNVHCLLDALRSGGVMGECT